MHDATLSLSTALESTTLESTTLESTTSSLPEVTDTARSAAPERGVVAISAAILVRRTTPRRHEKPLATQRIEEQCRTLNRSVFFRGAPDTRVLGFTSAIAGEGRTFLAAVCADMLARDTRSPVVLLECDWEHPSYHKLFDLPARQGIAEWLRGEVDIADIRYQVRPHLTIIPAGNGADDAIQFIRRLRNPDTMEQLLGRDALGILDLPPLLTCAYGRLAAELPDAVVMVVRAGATQGSQVAQACGELAGIDVRGMLLNHARSHVPGWLRSIL